MNTRIEQLTRNYLNGLNLPYYSRLSNDQKRRIIEINNQSEWIIFNAGSLRAKRLEVASYVPMLYVSEDEQIWDSGRTGETGRFVHIRDYIERYRHEIGIVGDYRLGEREEVRNNQNAFLGYRRAVLGRLRNHEGMVNSAFQHLRAPHDEMDRGFSPESYEITENLLKDVLKEVLRIYYPTDDPNSLDADNINFMGEMVLQTPGIFTLRQPSMLTW